MRDRIKKLMDKVNEARAEAHAIGLEAGAMNDQEIGALVDDGRMRDLCCISLLMMGTGKYMQSLIAQRIVELSSRDSVEAAVNAWNSGMEPACASCPCDACESERAAARKAAN